MADMVSPLLQWLNAHPQFAGIVTFIISAAESIAIIGTIVPGSITMTAIGALAGAGVIPLWGTLIWAILGAIAGDGVSYWIGYHFKDRLPYIWPFNRYPTLLTSGEKFFIKHGGMSVFIGRFVGPVRALVPLVAGMLGMRPLHFLIANVASAIGWAPAYMLPGILLGAASLELPSDIAMHVILVLLLMTLFILLCLWFIYKLLQLIHNQTTYLQDAIWHRLQGNRIGLGITYILKHHDPSKTHGQLNLAIYFTLTCFLFFSLVMYTSLVGPQHITVNDACFHLFRGIRYPQIDKVMIYLTLLGQKEILLPAMLLFALWLIYKNKFHAAGHVIALGAVSTIAIYFLKHAIQLPRPWGLMANSESFSMPSGHATLATIAYMGLAILITSALEAGQRIYFYTFAIIMIFLVCLSRLYLGAHWFTDIVGGILLGSSILIAIIISYQRTYQSLPSSVSLLVVSLTSILLTYSIYFSLHAHQLRLNYQLLAWPIKEVKMPDWWQNQQSILPAYQASLFGFPTQKINIIWLGNKEDIERTLYQEGWTKPPARDVISTLHRIADISSTEYLPLVSPLYLDKAPTLTLTRRAAEQRSLLVVRIWYANRIINGLNLWVGIVGTIPRPYSWIFGKHQGELTVYPSLLLPFNDRAKAWQWKLTSRALGEQQPTVQYILFIRPKKTV